MDALFYIAILIISIVIHEVSHGIAALWEGDPTAKYAGRLTINPIPHIDPVGSIIVPILCALSGTGLYFGWAKPVPVNPYNFRNRRWGEALVAIAGPLSNLIIATLAGLSLRFWFPLMPDATVHILAITVLINIVLAIFNLVPVPPLDGSKILFALLPQNMAQVRYNFERYGLFVTLIFIIFVWQYFAPLIYIVFSWITGIQLQ